MAIARGLASKLSGTINKELVFKQYPDKTVVTKYADMSKVKPTEQQRCKRSMFADAVVYAKAIIGDREKKALYAKKVKKGQTVYHYAIKEYMAAHKGDVVMG